MSNTDWPPRRNAPPPKIDPLVQDKLAEIFGNNPYGEPLIRLAWGQSVTQFFHEQYRLKYPAGRRTAHIGWGVPVTAKGKVTGYRPIYPPTANPPSKSQTGGKLVVKLVETEQIGVPRWFVEQWIGPRVACQNWESERWEWRYDPAQGIHRNVDMLGPAPTKGMYAEALYCIASHENPSGPGKLPPCCAEKSRQGFLCYGEYRAPDQRDIDHIGRLKQALDADSYHYGYDELPPQEVLAQDMRDTLYRFEQQQQKGEQYLKEMIADELRPHTSRLLTDGGRLDKAKYKFVPPEYGRIQDEAAAGSTKC